MTQVLADRIRLALNQASKASLSDVFSGGQPTFYRGNDLQVEMASFLGDFLADGTLDDISNIDSITVAFKAGDRRTGVPLMSVTIPSGSLNAAMTADQWATGDPAQWQALAQFTSSDTNLDMQGQQQLSLWMVVSAILNGPAVLTVPASSFRERTSNVATLSITGHGIPANSVITVTGVGGSGYNVSNVVVTVVDANHISYASVGGNESSTADTGASVTVVSTPLKKVTLGTGTATIIETGFDTAPPSYVQGPTYLTAAQSDARYSISSTKVSKSGDTMTGSLAFSGTTNPGILLSNLTTTQRTALSNLAGNLVWDTTVPGAFVNTGSAWKQLVTSVNTATGDVTLTTDNVAEGATNQYFTLARVRATTLTGLTGSYSAVTASDTVLTALSKLAAYSAAATGTGSVTSVALAGPAALFTVSGSPVTTTGTLTFALAQQSANVVFAGPTSGGTATPTWRSLVAADIPAIAESGVTNLTTDLASKLPLAGGTLTGPLTLASYSGELSIVSPVQGMIVFDTVEELPAVYNGSSWVFLTPTSGSGFLPLTGGTVTGPIVLPGTTPSGNQAASFNFVNGTYAALAGATFSGSVKFTGSTTSFSLPNLSTPQRLALTPAAGMMVFDTTMGTPFVYTGVFWQSPLTAAGALLLSGGTMVGDITFSGTTHAGMVLNNLSTTQKTSITPSAGMIVFDVTAGLPSFYTGSAWVNITSGSGLPTTGGTMTGDILFSGTGHAGIKLNTLTSTQALALSTTGGEFLNVSSWRDGTGLWYFNQGDNVWFVPSGILTSSTVLLATSGNVAATTIFNASGYTSQTLFRVSAAGQQAGGAGTVTLTLTGTEPTNTGTLNISTLGNGGSVSIITGGVGLIKYTLAVTGSATFTGAIKVEKV